MAYLQTKHGDIPLCAKWFIQFSKFYLKFIRRHTSKLSKRASVIFERASMIFEPGAQTEMINVIHESGQSSSTSTVGVDNNETDTSGSGSASKKMSNSDNGTSDRSRHCNEVTDILHNNGSSAADYHDDDADDIESLPLLASDLEGPHDTSQWEQFARAVDRVCRFFSPIVFVVLVCLKFHEVDELW